MKILNYILIGLFLFWIAGFLLDFAGDVIHVVLVGAILVFLYKMFIKVKK